MFRKTIKYKNFNDEEVSEDFYFHLSKAELLSMAGGAEDMQARIQRIIATQDVKAVLDEFRKLIEMSIGAKTEDGKLFVKDDAARDRLLKSPAYDELLMELCTDAEASAKFVTQLVPEKMQKEMIAQMQAGVKNSELNETGRNVLGDVSEEDPRPQWEKEGRNPTQEELRNMNTQELQYAFSKRVKVAENPKP